MHSGPAPKPTCKPELVKETHYTGVVEVPSAATPSAAPSPQNEERNHSPSTPDQRLDVPLMDYLSSLGKPDLLQLQEDVLLWFERREELGDIQTVDPTRVDEMTMVLKRAKEVIKQQELIQEEKERGKKECRSISAQAHTMALQQLKGNQDPAMVEMVRCQIDSWRNSKEGVLEQKMWRLKERLQQLEEVLAAGVWEILSAALGHSSNEAQAFGGPGSVEEVRCVKWHVRHVSS